MTLPRKTRKQGGGQRSCYDGTGPRTSADGFSGPNRTCDEETAPLPPPAMFSEEKSNKFVNFGCAECEGQTEHEKIKSLLKQKKVKGGFKVAHKAGEKPDGPSGEVWTRSAYSTLPNPRQRGYSLGQKPECQPGSQV